MKKLLFAGLAIAIPAVLSAQSKSATNEASPVIREMIVKAFVAQPNGKRIDHGRMIRISINRYDAKGRVLETMSSTGIDTVAGKEKSFVSEKRSYRYDTKGQLRSTVNRRQDGSVIDSMKNKPGDKPTLPDWYTYKSTGTPLKKEAYVFDRGNNWVKLVTYENGKPSRIIERVINYY